MPTFIEAVATAIVSQGVTDTFGLMGAGTIRLVDHLTREGSGVRYFASRHEAGAVGAADGYSRVSGRVGVALVTWGAGFTNCITAITTAKRASSPIVLIAADATTAPIAKFPFAAGVQAVNQSALLSAIDVPVIVAHPTSVSDDIERAFKLAIGAGTPVTVLLPVENETEAAQDRGNPGRNDISSPRLKPTEASILGACDLLKKAQRPIILAGWGAVCADAEKPLSDLADRTGAVLATTQRGSGLFSDHPYYVGLCGGLAQPQVQAVLKEADCVVSFGASLNGFTTDNGMLFRNAEIIQCDLSPAAFHRYIKASTTVCGDAAMVADQLFAALNGKDTDGTFRKSISKNAIDVAEAKRCDAFKNIPHEGRLDPRAIGALLNKILPSDRIVVADSGLFALSVVDTLRVRRPRRFHWMINYGAIGSGFGAGIGAAIADQSRLTALFIGDGGFFMSMGDLDMAVRSRLPMLIVCMNDGAYGAELRHMRQWDIPLDNARFETPDLAAIARAMGADAERITNLDQIERLSDRFKSLDGPLFLDCVVAEGVLPEAMMSKANH